MNCEDRNQDLLLLAHGELGGIRKALVEQHLRRCPRCQERRHRYDALSSVIAGEVRPREMPAWTPHAAHLESAPLSAQRLALCVALAILLSVAAAAGAVWGPGSGWSIGRWGIRFQASDSCQTNAPANLPINPPASPANQPAPLPAGNHAAPAANAPTAPAACLTPAPSAPPK